MRSNQIGNQTRLYIFATSHGPDVYINVLGHCVEYFNNLVDPVLVGIEQDRGKVRDKRRLLNQIKNQIFEQVDCLLQGKYRKKDSQQCEEPTKIIEDHAFETYGKIERLDLQLKVIVYEDMEKDITTILDESKSNTCIFDVSGILNRHLIDLYHILRSKGVKEIFSFELPLTNQPLSYDDRDLIHNRTYNETYKYICHADSMFTKNQIITNDIKNRSISDNNIDQGIQAFVIMQYTKVYNQLYDEVIEPTVKMERIHCIRADREFTTGLVTTKIAQYIEKSAFIIADITPDNPNVFYELGYAHAINKPVILLSNLKRKKVPFDINNYDKLTYENNSNGRQELKGKLKECIKKVLS